MADILTALRRLKWAVQRSKRATVAVGRDFIRSDKTQTTAPPLSRVLKGGRGGETRLKVYLSMLLIGAKHPHEVQLRSAYWAEMLNLDDPEVNGARRVNDALNWLSKSKLINLVRQPGEAPVIRPLAESCLGSKYVRPGGVTKYTWARLPVAFWSSGWILVLSAPAIAVLLALLEIERGKEHSNPIAPRGLEERYGLSRETWQKGARELKTLGLLKVDKGATGDEAEWKRYRNNYTILHSKFAEDAFAAADES